VQAQVVRIYSAFTAALAALRAEVVAITTISTKGEIQMGDFDGLLVRFERCRALTEALSSSLSDADATVQSMPDASPAKWHLAHTSWFFETFVLRPYVPGYAVFDESFHFLFNSYYEAEGPRLARPVRGLQTRPSLDTVRSYRAHVTDLMSRHMASFGQEAQKLVELGCQHEQQHQELLLTDILHLLSNNPAFPKLWEPLSTSEPTSVAALSWIPGQEGVVQIGHEGSGFSFDCEGPAHKVWLPDHSLSNRLITNGEWLEFIESGGYGIPALWLSDGWTWVQQNSIDSPLYWRRDKHGDWSSQFGLMGLEVLNVSAPVCHISYFEAEAFARWAGCRLPTEAEWEHAAGGLDPSRGNLLDRPGAVYARGALQTDGLQQMFGDVWEWTGSAYLPYPGFMPAPGAVGEYNGKFMSGQFVLKGGSCATPRGHSRASYRNFFYPHQRWQFTGLRLAKNNNANQ